MSKTTTKKTPLAAARGRGRPRAEHKLEKLIAYMLPETLGAARKAARTSGARSLSSWASQVLEREARRVLRTGVIPLDVLELPSAPDPTGSIRKAVREERDSGSSTWTSCRPSAEAPSPLTSRHAPRAGRSTRSSRA